MNFIDVVILIVVLGIVAAILYFNIWKNRKKPCKGCPYAASCSNCPSKEKNKKGCCH